jgi:hypothetical protein
MADAEGERTDRDGRWAAISVAVALLLGVLYAVVGRVALRGFPYSGDEYSCLLQAEIFARGLFHTAAPPHPELLRVDHVIVDPWVRSKYPPGTSALLAIGVKAGAAWLVMPIAAVVALLATWATTRAHLGNRHAAIALLVLGLSPLFAFHAATFYAHTLTTMWLALAIGAVSRWCRRGGVAWPLLAGGATGCALLTRPADAAFFFAALLVFRSGRLVAAVAAGLTPFVVAYFAYQAVQFGSPFVDGYHAYEATFRSIYGETGTHPVALSYVWDPKQLANHLDQICSLVQDWTVPGSVLVAIVGAFAVDRAHPARAMRDFLVAVAVVPLAGLLLLIGDPDDGARPRYLSTTLLSVAFLAGPGWDATRTALATLVGTRLARLAAVAGLAMGPIELGGFLGHRIPELWRRDGLFEQVSALGIEEGVVVVRADWPTRYARNGPFFNRPVLYLSPSAEMTLEQIAALYPGRPLYEATEGRRWRIVRRL